MSFQAGSPSHDLKGLGSDRSIEVEPWGTKEEGVGGRWGKARVSGGEGRLG